MSTDLLRVAAAMPVITARDTVGTAVETSAVTSGATAHEETSAGRCPSVNALIIALVAAVGVAFALLNGVIAVRADPDRSFNPFARSSAGPAAGSRGSWTFNATSVAGIACLSFAGSAWTRDAGGGVRVLVALVAFPLVFLTCQALPLAVQRRRRRSSTHP